MAYLARQHDADRAGYEHQVARTQPDLAGRVLLSFDLAAAKASRRDFRGCLYLNAATEFPGADSPVSGVVAEHRQWLSTTWKDALDEFDHPSPGTVVDQLMVLYDGGLAGSKAARSVDPIHTARSLAETVLRG